MNIDFSKGIVILAVLIFGITLVLYQMGHMNGYAVENAKWLLGAVGVAHMGCECVIKKCKIDNEHLDRVNKK